MNLLKALEPFAENLKHFKDGYGITDTIVIQKLADIWDAFADTRKKEIYGSDTVQIPKTKTSCSSCIKDMMNMLINWRRIVTEEGNDYVEFNGVKDKRANVKEVSIKEAKQKVDDVVASAGPALTFKEVHEQLTAKGIKYHHKAKLPSLLKLLNESK